MSSFSSLLKVVAVPCLKDNYAYLIFNRLNRRVAVVDPSDATLVHDAFLKEQDVLHTQEEQDREYEIDMILNTHHHWDHTAGNVALINLIRRQSIRVFGGDRRVPNVTDIVGDGDSIEFGAIKITALWTPCHTSGSICFHLTPTDGTMKGDGVVFTGDTLFLGGCGRFFEGTASQMLQSLEKLALLPAETKVYCGHEYTLSNLQFALSIDTENVALKERVRRLIERKETEGMKLNSMPGSIGEEKVTNVFMRCGDKSVQKAIGVDNGDVVATMQKLREAKNHFSG
jgi:hydroxyacylglutathione hydrolase